MSNTQYKSEGEAFKAYTAFQWSADEAGKPIILLRGSVYSHTECVELSIQLSHLLKTWEHFNVVVHKGHDKK